MDAPKTVKQYRQYFHERGIDSSTIKERYGDLRKHDTWAQAYSDMSAWDELPIIKAIDNLTPNLSQPENFVPPAPPILPPIPVITQPLLPPAKDNPPAPPPEQPAEKPGDGRRENRDLQRLPHYHQQLRQRVFGKRYQYFSFKRKLVPFSDKIYDRSSGLSTSIVARPPPITYAERNSNRSRNNCCFEFSP